MTNIQIPDRSRASLAPYLPIPYGSLKLLGMVLSLVVIVIALVAGFLWFPSYGWSMKLGIFISMLVGIILMLIIAVAACDVEGEWVTDWFPAYWDRNWRGYRLWVYQQNTVSAPVRYQITREGDDRTFFWVSSFPILAIDHES